MDKYVCMVCGYVYDPAQGDPDNGVPAGTQVAGYPHLEVSRWRRAMAALKSLPELMRRVRRLEAALEHEKYMTANVSSLADLAIEEKDHATNNLMQWYVSEQVEEEASIDEIVERKSKNGVTLYSLAPLADGSLPPSQVEGLKELGAWMAINKEALYAAKPPKFVEGAPELWKTGTMRFLAKGDFIYAVELGNEIINSVDEFAGQAEQFDDITVLIIHNE